MDDAEVVCAAVNELCYSLLNPQDNTFPCDCCQKFHAEVRLLPTGGGGNMIACHDCFLKAMRDRHRDAETYGGKLSDQWNPAWHDLKVYDPS